MKRILWREWAESFPALDLASHPTVIKVARTLAEDSKFLEWMGHVHPVVMTLEPICLIAVSALCRVRIRHGKFDISHVTAKVRPERFDEEIGVPGLFKAMWAAGLIDSVSTDRVNLCSPPGAFPRGYDEKKTKQLDEQREQELAAVRDKTLIGLTTSK